MNFLRNFVFSIHPISEDSLAKYDEILQPKHFLKNHKLVNLGETPQNIYVLKSGLIRAYIVDEKGTEHTRTIYPPLTSSGNLGALIKNEPSNLIYECLTDCEVLECNYQSFYNLSLKHHELSIFHYKVLERIYIREESKILDLTQLNATDRYKKLQENIPDINNLINQYHIASYLNITPVQLSRIRKKC